MTAPRLPHHFYRIFRERYGKEVPCAFCGLSWHYLSTRNKAYYWRCHDGVVEIKRCDKWYMMYVNSPDESAFLDWHISLPVAVFEYRLERYT